MAAFSMDLPERVVTAFDRGDVSTRQLAELFEVSRSWISKLLLLPRERGLIAAIDCRLGPNPKLSDDQLDQMCLLVADEPDLTADEIRRRLRLLLSASRVSATLLEVGFTRTKSPSRRPNSSGTTRSKSGPASPAS